MAFFFFFWRPCSSPKNESETLPERSPRMVHVLMTRYFKFYGDLDVWNDWNMQCTFIEQINNSKGTVFTEPRKSVWHSMSFILLRVRLSCRMYKRIDHPRDRSARPKTYDSYRCCRQRQNSNLVPICILAIIVVFVIASHFQIHILMRIWISKLINLRIMHLFSFYWSSREAIDIVKFTYDCSECVRTEKLPLRCFNIGNSSIHWARYLIPKLAQIVYKLIRGDCHACIFFFFLFIKLT